MLAQPLLLSLQHKAQIGHALLDNFAAERPPVLLIHGDDDKNVDYGQSLLLARELTAREVPFEEMSVPNERHDFFRYANWLAAYRAAEDFFDRRLTGKPPETLPIRGNDDD